MKESISEKKRGNQRTLLSYLGISLKGFCMGAADIVPGVSGGTMALILGIYEELIRAVRSFDLVFLKLLFSSHPRSAMGHLSWQFLASLASGIFIAIFSLAKILSWLLQYHPVPVWSFFFGLILASVFLVSRHLPNWTLSLGFSVLMGAAGAYILVGMIPLTTPEAPWFLFISGVIAICAMILPGISGSFILVLLGKYKYVLEAVNNRDITTLLIVAAGAGIGLISFVRLLNWLLKKYHNLTMAVLTGLMLGSLRKIWPWKDAIKTVNENQGSSIITEVNILPKSWNDEVTIAFCLMILGITLVFSMNLLAKSKSGRNL